MSRGVTSSTDLKVANVIGMSPSMTEITLGLQTMMCCMAWHRFSTSRADVHWAEEPTGMVTKIRANVALGVGGAGAQTLDQDSGCRGSDPLAFGNLDPDDIINVY